MTNSESGDGQAVIRPAEAVDAEVIAEIWHQGWRDGHLGHVPDELVAARTESSFRLRARARVGDTTVVEVAGEVVGFVMVADDEVEQVYLAAGSRGSGVADVLLAEAERQVAVGGHDVAWLAVVAGNTRARRFYRRKGWVDAGPFDYGAASAEGVIPVPSQRYEKRLPKRG